MMSWGINKSYKAMESMTGTRVWWAVKRGLIIIKMRNEWLLGGKKSVLSCEEIPAHVHVMFTRLLSRRYNTAHGGPDSTADQTTVRCEVTMTGHLKLLHQTTNNPSPTFPQDWIDSIIEQSCFSLLNP